jgi:hypothetical protein
MDKTYVGAYLEILAPKQKWFDICRECPDCKGEQEEGDFCMYCGQALELVRLEKERNAQYTDFVNCGTHPESYNDLRQIPHALGINGEFYVISFDGPTPYVITPRTPVSYITDFYSIHFELIKYLLSLFGNGIDSLDIQFGVIRYYD